MAQEEGILMTFSSPLSWPSSRFVKMIQTEVHEAKTFFLLFLDRERRENMDAWMEKFKGICEIKDLGKK